MTFTVRDIAGMQALVCDPSGPPLSSKRDATDLIGESLGADATLVVIPVTRLSPEFFRLASGLAGAVVQKHVNYGRRLVILGDIAAHEQASGPFRDFVREANRGSHLWFLADEASLMQRLRAG